MAAVVASLAAVVGCGLPALQLSIGSDRGRGLCDGEGGTARELWCSEKAKASALQGGSAATVASAAPPSLKKPSAPATEPATPESSATPKSGSDEVESKAPSDVVPRLPHAPGALKRRGVRAGLPARRVRFDPSAITTHEVTPYAEVYGGVHPRDFNFAKGQPAPGSRFVDRLPRSQAEHQRLTRWPWSDEDDDEDEDGDDAENGILAMTLPKAFRVLTGQRSRSLPGPSWPVLCVLVFLVRVFGAQACLELVARGFCAPVPEQGLCSGGLSAACIPPLRAWQEACL